MCIHASISLTDWQTVSWPSPLVGLVKPGVSNARFMCTSGQFYEWLQGPFTEGLLPEERYDGSAVQPEEQRVMCALHDCALHALQCKASCVWVCNHGCLTGITIVLLAVCDSGKHV